MKKTRALVKTKPADDTDSKFELLLSRGRADTAPVQTRFKSRVRIHIALFVVGLLGSIGCLWAMLYTSDSEEVAKKLGLHRVANSLENILSLLAYPVLLFMAILTLYAGQQLYWMYREANDPESFGRRRTGR